MIQAVLFDLDRTLLDRDTSFRNFVASQYERYKAALNHISPSDYIDRVVQLDNRGLLWKDKVYQVIVSEFPIRDLSWEELFADFDSRITDYYLPLPGMRMMLEALKMTGYSLGLVTNGRTRFQKRSIEALGIERDFQAILISESEGVRKPDPEIFHRALNRLNARPEHALFVGDSLEADIRGAKAVGMFTAWIRDPGYSGNHDADFAFSKLEDLPGLIRNLTK